ncbi:hypothetical protein FOA52_006654 [Chlamydomonas sp. UWO 241]|nr:hypothetical protein FOA52_006654 [Chlamydomonas sp. UWO 241]
MLSSSSTLRTSGTARRACSTSASRPGTVARPRPVALTRATENEAAPSNVCKLCGVAKGEMEQGCDGEGHVIGGLASVPLLAWWPLKVYRPCSKLEPAGIEYTRKGQPLNDVLFGGVSLGKAGAASLDEMRKTSERGLDIK